MNTSRRKALQKLIALSAGAALLPYCREAGKEGMPLKNIRVDGKQQDMIAELSETILPKTNSFIGAKDIRAHEFVLIMMDDCSSPEEQKKFMDGLAAFEKFCKDTAGKDFSSCTMEQRVQLLKMIEAGKATGDMPNDFYGKVKQYTVQAFTTSKTYLTDVRKYKMVPGSNFKGCVKIKNA